MGNIKLITAVAVAGVIIGTACSSGHPTTVSRPGPIPTTTTTLAARRFMTTPGTHVPARDQAVVITLVAGLNPLPPSAPVVVAGARYASLVSAIAQPTSTPRGTIHCPLDDGRYYQLAFAASATARPDFTLKYGANGCFNRTVVPAIERAIS